MRVRLLLPGLVFAVSTKIDAQAVAPKDSLIAPPRVPAQSLIDARDALQLSEGQLAKLRVLARAQAAALTHATASYLRAEADLLDASRKDDIAGRRLALEKRAKIGIDGEIARLQGEKDARVRLTIDQREKLQQMLDRAETEPRENFSAAWAPLVTPSP